MASIRQRFRDVKASEDISEPTYQRKHHRRKRPSALSTTTYLLSSLALIFVIYVIVIYVEKRLPPGLKLSDEHSHPDRFIAESAMNYLKNLTDIGIRVVGSKENEVDAVNFLLTEIENIKENAKYVHVIEVDVQHVTGVFPLTFLDGMTNAYDNLQNIVVKVGSRINSTHSLLLNCHFDTVADSIGASDDGAGCAVMLEIMRVLTKSDRVLRHNVIFLFNGGEESFMPASHGFITQHRWADEIRAFINIEACGSGGRELLFQAGPNNPWILETYSSEAPHPHASSIAQELFETGLFPGDTDYRIFRDYGKLAGLDFAWSRNGYVFHTMFDTVDKIQLGSLQRTGDNILALTKGMANGHQISDIENYESGNLIFFDFLGSFVVRWPESVATYINIAAVLLSFYTICVNLFKCGIETKKYVKNILHAVIGTIVSWFLALITVLLVAQLLNVIDRKMSWYGHHVWIVLLYVCPTLLAVLTTILLHSRIIKQSPWLTFQTYNDGLKLIWTTALIACTVLKVRSGLVPLFWVIFPSLGSILKQKIFSSNNESKSLPIFLALIAIPYIQCLYLIVGALLLLIPVMGRSGNINSEFLIAAITGAFFSTLNGYISPLIVLINKPKKVLLFLFGVFTVSVAILILTPLGFPYSGDPNSLSPQRFSIGHVERKFYNESNELEAQSTGYWIVDLDINSPHTVDSYVPEMQQAQIVDKDCQKYLYCGFPYPIPIQSFVWQTHFIPAPGPYVPTPTNLQVIAKFRYKDETGNGVKVILSITGADNMGIMISPREGVELLRWELYDETPLASSVKWNDRDTYFIHYSSAGEVDPLEFAIDFQIPNARSHKKPIMDIAIGSHFKHGPHKRGEAFQKFLDQFPEWTAITAWTTTYTSWVV